MEASGEARWFERLLAELNLELWIGDTAEIRAMRVRKTEDRSPGCAAYSETHTEGRLSANLGRHARFTRLRKCEIVRTEHSSGEKIMY
jgi:hypothetical protein